MSQHGKALLVEAVEVEDGFGGGRCIPQHGVDRMTGQQRTRGVDDMDHRDLAPLPADGDAPVVQDLERVAIESVERERPLQRDAVR